MRTDVAIINEGLASLAVNEARWSEPGYLAGAVEAAERAVAGATSRVSEL